MAEAVVVVAGAGGFIGGHLTTSLLRQGNVRVRAVDVKPQAEWFQVHPNAQNLTLDLRLREHCFKAVEGATEVYNLAADMGGMGFIENNKALCMLSVLINTHLLLAVKEVGAKRFFFASSACVYAASKQNHTRLEDGLRETDTYPAMPEDGYGWEKLFNERMCRHFQEDFGVAARIARYHNVYGPHGTWDGGREKAPAAICRKVIRAKLAGLHEIEIWGDGEQTRSFTYIDDCVKGTELLMRSGISEPLNVGSEQMVTINQLVDIVEKLAGIKLKRTYNFVAPKGVRGRNSNNELIRKLLDWAPNTRLEAGMEKTYRWIHDEIVSGKQSKVGG